MKRIFLSFAVIASFAVYSFFRNSNNSFAALPATTPTSNQINLPIASGVKLKDGTYTGQAADASYGNIQVQAVIKNGQLTDVQFLDYPQDRMHSLELSNQTLPQLRQEAIKNQSAKVDIISGATDTSRAFEQSLSSALVQAAS